MFGYIFSTHMLARNFLIGGMFIIVTYNDNGRNGLLLPDKKADMLF